MSFVPLHVHTEYSLLDGSCKIRELAARAAALGMKALAITDHGVMYGVIDFYRACRAEGIKPIIGCEVYVAPGSRFDREASLSRGDDRYHHMVLLARNNEGYQNLMKIVSRGFTEGFYYKPRVDLEILREYSGGITALSACLAGAIPRLLLRGRYEEACAEARKYEEIFGKGNFFLELQDHGIAEQKAVNQALLRMSQDLGIDLVATNDTHYIFSEDAKAHDILLCIQTGKKVSDENRMRYEGGQYYLKSEEEMRALFPYALQALENTRKIADSCNVEIEFGVTKLPRFDVPEGFSSWTYLNSLCNDGLKKRYPDDDGTLKAKLDYELGVIQKMGYVDYFLIVWDFIHYARSQGIPVGPGRGSAAGSIVSYTLGITDIDPVKYSLLFERFLNPERVSMPDIDIDFCYERRPEVIDYVVKKYGKDNVVQIVTFGTMAARGVVRDVGRVLDLPYARCDQISKMIPQELGITLKKALEVSPDLKKACEEDPQVKGLIDMSMRLEGLPRHTSMHAAGVVIGQRSMDEFVPLSRAADGTITTQYTMTTLEELGLLKMDFLGLRTLTVIKDALDQIEKNHGLRVDISAIDLNDKKVLEMIGQGRCEGVFQLESTGMKNFMKELKPENLEDIIAGISLYRPGPMDFIPRYLKGKNDASAITYECRELEPILSPTYGCIVYQEQVMQIVRDLAGYTMGRSDLVRRAMSKKKTAVMEKERQNFVWGNEAEGVPGCVARGIPADVANHIYDEMTDFAKYAFNKSHAACYAVVAMRTAWLKFYYPEEFMAALMTSVMDTTSKIAEYILVCRQMGIKILPPDINEGRGEFTVCGGGIRYGLSAIKAIGRNVVDQICEDREKYGRFSSLEDFVTRMIKKGVNRRAMEAFVKSGAMDCLDGNRRQKLYAIPAMAEQKSREKKTVMEGQISLFDLMGAQEKKQFAAKLPGVDEFDRQELLAYEKETMGVYLSGHPLDEYMDLWKECADAKTTDFYAEEEDGQAVLKDGARVTVGGIITELKTKITKNGQLMAFVTLEDMVGSLEILVFPRDFEKHRDKLKEDAKVFVNGRASMGDEGSGKLILENLAAFDDVPGELWMKFASADEYAGKKNTVMEILTSGAKNSPGKDRAVLYLASERAVKRLDITFCMKACGEMIASLEHILGKKNLAFRRRPLKWAAR